MKEEVIKLENVSMCFGKKSILEHISLQVTKGETIAFTGENGSGKSTLLKMIGGLIRPTKGKVIINPIRKIGYIPERFDKLNFNIPEYLHCIGGIDGLTKEEINSISQELYQLFFLEDMLQTPMKFLSKGTLQKVAVIQALMVKPDILLLDEPLSGQDYLSQKRFVERMMELKKQGVTILMSCHEQYLVEQLADRVLHLENHHFVETCLSSQNKNLPYYLMLFEGERETGTRWLEQLRLDESIHELTRKDNVIRVVVQKEKGQQILKLMLEHNYSLQKFEEI